MLPPLLTGATVRLGMRVGYLAALAIDRRWGASPGDQDASQPASGGDDTGQQATGGQVSPPEPVRRRGPWRRRR